MAFLFHLFFALDSTPHSTLNHHISFMVLVISLLLLVQSPVYISYLKSQMANCYIYFPAIYVVFWFFYQEFCSIKSIAMEKETCPPSYDPSTNQTGTLFIYCHTFCMVSQNVIMMLWFSIIFFMLIYCF